MQLAIVLTSVNRDEWYSVRGCSWR